GLGPPMYGCKTASNVRGALNPRVARGVQLGRQWTDVPLSRCEPGRENERKPRQILPRGPQIDLEPEAGRRTGHHFVADQQEGLYVGDVRWAVHGPWGKLEPGA